jgi:hypothetical protein
MINFGIIAYFVWYEPIFLEVLRQAPVQPNIPIGLALMILQVLNLFSIIYKGRFVRQRMGSLGISVEAPADGGVFVEYPENFHHIRRLPRRFPENQRMADTESAQISQGQKFGFIIILVGMGCYVLVSALVVWNTLDLLCMGNTAPFWQGLLGVLYFIPMFALSAGLTIDSLFPDIPNFPWSFCRKIGEIYPMTVEWVADIVLAAFSVTAFTIVWAELDASAPATTPQDIFGKYLVLVMFFCIVYLATNIHALADLWLVDRPKWVRWLSIDFFLIIMFTAIHGKVG